MNLRKNRAGFVPNRRFFIRIYVIILSGLLAQPSISSHKHGENHKIKALDNKEKIEKVKLAMLTMQRLSWEQGTAAQALLEMGEIELAILMAKEAHLRRLKDGRAGVVTRSGYAVNDPAANGEVLLYAAKITGDSTLRQTAYDMIDYLLHKAERSKDGVLSHISTEIKIMSDAMYMTPPFLAVAGYYGEAVAQIEGIRKYLWNSEKQLFSHVWSEKSNDFEREDFWGVGNGWCAAGMARVIDALPENMHDVKKRLMQYVIELLDGCLAYIRDDGLFHDVIDKPDTFVETNLSQMLAYTIYRGVHAGWINSDYLEYADQMRGAANNKVDPYGLVQDVCGAPSFDHPGVAAEGQAFFLLMEAAAMKIAE